MAPATTLEPANAGVSGHSERAREAAKRRRDEGDDEREEEGEKRAVAATSADARARTHVVRARGGDAEGLDR